MSYGIAIRLWLATALGSATAAMYAIPVILALLPGEGFVTAVATSEVEQVQAQAIGGGDGTCSAEGGCTDSPCSSLYRDWLSTPGDFPRDDEPKYLAGLHIGCVWRLEGVDDGFLFEVYKNAVDSGATPQRKIGRTEDLADWIAFRKFLKKSIGFKRASNNWGHIELKQPFGVFGGNAVRLKTAEEAFKSSLVLIIEGGQWFWPPVRTGFVRKMHEFEELELVTVSVQPVIISVQNFLLSGEGEHIMQISAGRMEKSGVSLMDKDKAKKAKDFRTSSQAFVPKRSSKILMSLDERISRMVRVPRSHNEEPQVLNYNLTEYYSAHLDNWDPQYYSDSAWFEHGYKNRFITVFWYLTDVAVGGETIFPRAHGLPQPRDMWSCDRGLKVTPEARKVIFWYSLKPNGNTDANGLHGGCPVITGNKWSTNFWVWNKPRF